MRGTFYQVEHVTRYVHAGRASTSQHVACLQPRVSPRLTLHAHDLDVDPAPGAMVERLDYFGNVLHQFEILTPYLEMCAVSRSLVEVWPRVDSINFDDSPSWESVRAANAWNEEAAGGAEVPPFDPDIEYCFASPYVTLDPALADFARASFPQGRPFVAGAIDLMRRIHSEFRFDPGATTITTPITRVLSERHGVCQDFAHLQIGCLRSLGLPARYVSGYMLTDPPPGQPRLVGADASHAWLSIRCPRLGWIDLDPTNDALPDVRHVTVAWGRDYGDVSPLRGIVLGGQRQTLHVGVSVIPVDPPAWPGLVVS
ncbi:MAG: transglutaminase family protein [Vicinamibacterales bacterium]